MHERRAHPRDGGVPRRPSPHPSRRRTRASLVAVGATFVLMTVGAACSSGDGGVAAGTSSTTAPPSTAPPSAVNATAPCTDQAILPVIQAKHPGATLADLVCDNRAAVATVLGVAEFGGDGVAFFTSRRAEWSVEASGPIAGDPSKVLPASFSTALFGTWRNKYDAAHAPPTSAPAPNTPTSPTVPRVTRTTRCDPKNAGDGGCPEPIPG